jgi:hypothetical protein
MTNRWNLPDLGFGVGLRSVHYEHVLDAAPDVDWFEILSENYLVDGGWPLFVLDRVAEQYPIAMHGVSLSIGSTDPIDFEFLGRLRALAERANARWVGDHICWTGVAGRNTHDLLPLPLDEPTLRHVVERVRIVQDVLERPLVLENASTYAEFARSSMPEQEWIARLLEDADCALLLDVNNVFVTCRNHGHDPSTWLDAIPYDRVVQVHVAGHTDKGTHIVDTHVGPVPAPVWELYADVMRRTGGCSTLLEWDTDIPDFPTVHAEVLKARPYRATAARR